MSKLTDTARNAKAKAGEKGAAAKRKAGEVYGRGRDAASRSAQSSREMAQKAKAKSGETIDRNPFAAVVGGLALGAIAAALLPKSEREQKVLGKTGKEMVERAAKAQDVTHVRWAFSDAILPGQKGSVSYRGIVK